MVANKNFRGFGPYNFAVAATSAIITGSIIFSGSAALLPLLALAIIEIIFSFENAVINSQVLSSMSRIWRLIFLTVGIAIAVFGVRALLPIGLVAATTDDSLSEVLNLAIDQPEIYAAHLEAAYPLIAAFGGVFLLMVGLRFFGERRTVKWLSRFEAQLGEFNQPWWVSIGGAVLAVSAIYFFLAADDHQVALAGALGALSFLAIKLISKVLVGKKAGSHRNGLLQLIYLELLDASFSFDSVIAAFAITRDVVLIVAGLAIGAVFVRSMTLHMLRAGTLKSYRFLIHGAHYAILALSVLLLVGIKVYIPQATAGVICLLIIFTAFQSSRRFNAISLS